MLYLCQAAAVFYDLNEYDQSRTISAATELSFSREKWPQKMLDKANDVWYK
jgi:hypothetical protein